MTPGVETGMLCSVNFPAIKVARVEYSSTFRSQVPLKLLLQEKKVLQTARAQHGAGLQPYHTHIALAHEIHFLGTSHFIRYCFPFRREEPLTAAHGPVPPLNTITFRRTRGIDKSGEPLTARVAGLADICSKSLRIYEFHGVYRTALSLFWHVSSRVCPSTILAGQKGRLSQGRKKY